MWEKLSGCDKHMTSTRGEQEIDGFRTKLPTLGEDTSSTRESVWHNGKKRKFKGHLDHLILVLAFDTLILLLQNLNVRGKAFIPQPVRNDMAGDKTTALVYSW